VEIDPEQRFITGCAKIAGLEAGVKNLKSGLKKLSDRLDALEIQGFYDQITALNKKNDELASNLLETQRALAHERTNFLQLHMTQQIGLHFKNDNPLRQKLREDVLLRAAEATTEITSSPEPLKIANRFRKGCQDISKENHLSAFRAE
jgi:hypothetical protein